MLRAPIGDWNTCLDSAGALWVDDPNGLLYRWDDESHRHVVARDVEDVFCSAYGNPTVRDQHGLAVVRNSGLDRLPPIPGFKGYLNHYIFTGSVQTKSGLILAAVAGGAIGRSLWAFRNGQWERFLPAKVMPEVGAIYGDRKNQVLLGFRGSDAIGVLEHSPHRSPRGDRELNELIELT